MKYSWLKKVDDTIYFDGYLMEIYLPKYYFDKNVAKFIGNKINTLGLFEFRVIDEKGKVEKHTFKLPMNVIFEFDDYRSENIARSEDEVEPNYIFTLQNGMMFLDSVKKEQSGANSKNFIFSLHSNKLPSTLPYSDIIKLYFDNLILNKVNIGNPGCILEMTVAELCRSKDDVSVPFRKIIGENFKGTNDIDYKMTNVKNLPPINSTFAALSFENMDDSILSSIRKSINGEKEIVSPIEKITKY